MRWANEKERPVQSLGSVWRPSLVGLLVRGGLLELEATVACRIAPPALQVGEKTSSGMETALQGFAKRGKKTLAESEVRCCNSDNAEILEDFRRAWFGASPALAHPVPGDAYLASTTMQQPGRLYTFTISRSWLLDLARCSFATMLPAPHTDRQQWHWAAWASCQQGWCNLVATLHRQAALANHPIFGHIRTCH